MSTLPEDPRCLADVVADADWKFAEAFAAQTDTKPQHWFALLQSGVPFREVQRMADNLRRARGKAFQARRRA